MSIKLMNKVWELKTGLNTAQKMVLLKLADNANDAGVCWPSQSTIADQCELDRSTVNRAIKHLRKIGFVKIIDGFSNTKTCQYSIDLDVLQEVTPPVAGSHTTCCRKSQVPVAGSHTPYIEPPIEPPIEPSHNQHVRDEMKTFAPFLDAKTDGLWERYLQVWRGIYGELKAKCKSADVDAVFEWATKNYYASIGPARFFVDTDWPKIHNAYRNRDYDPKRPSNILNGTLEKGENWQQLADRKNPGL